MGCKKSSAENDSKTELITSAAWRINDIGIDQNRDGIIDATGTNYYPCLKDNTVVFNKDFSGMIDEGSSKCYPFDLQTSSVSWGFADSEASILISGPSASITLIHGKSTLAKLSATELALSKDTTIGGISGPVIVKLKH